MKDKTRELLEKVKEHHDWDYAPVKYSIGTNLCTEATCRLCGIQMRCLSDPPNQSEPKYTFWNYDGKLMPLIIVAQADCC